MDREPRIRRIADDDWDAHRRARSRRLHRRSGCPRSGRRSSPRSGRRPPPASCWTPGAGWPATCWRCRTRESAYPDLARRGGGRSSTRANLHLHDLVIAEDLRGRGLGRRLLRPAHRRRPAAGVRADLAGRGRRQPHLLVGARVHRPRRRRRPRGVRGRARCTCPWHCRREQDGEPGTGRRSAGRNTITRRSGMSSMLRVHDPFRRGQLATAALFCSLGFQYATWASRLPAIKSHLGLTAAEVGLLLMATGIGAVARLPAGGRADAAAGLAAPRARLGGRAGAAAARHVRAAGLPGRAAGDALRRRPGRGAERRDERAGRGARGRLRAQRDGEAARHLQRRVAGRGPAGLGDERA